MQRAFVVGGSGLCGTKLVEVLAESKQFSRVVLLGRRHFEHAKAPHIEDKVIDFENLNSEDFEGFDIGFCALGSKPYNGGTKMKYKVEYDYTLAVARLAKEHGTKTFVIVSGGSIDIDSRIYPFKIKGEVEKALAEVNFDRLVILRPGYIDGEKGGPLSCVFKMGSHLSASLYTTTDNVAKAMIYGSLAKGLDGQVIWNNKDLKGITAEYHKLVDA